MNLYMRLAFGCHLVAALLLSLFGLVYLFRPEFMPYHAVALSRDWDAVEQPVQILILALMRVVGGAWLATALAVMILLLIPFRQGAPWARWAIPAVGLVAAVPSLYATLYVGQNTPATPPWLAAVVSILLLMTGLILSLAARGNRPGRKRRALGGRVNPKSHR